MSQSDKSDKIGRRAALKRVLMTGTAMAVPGAFTHVGHAASRHRSGVSDDNPGIGTLGLLLPKEEEARKGSDALLSGIRQGLASSSVKNIQLDVTSTSCSESGIRTGLTELIENGADHVIAYVNTLHAHIISEIASTLQCPVTLVDGGANPIDAQVLSPWLRVETLDLFDRNRETGRRSATGTMNRAVVIVSTQEAQFQTAEALRTGFEGAGGEVIEYIVLDPTTDVPESRPEARNFGIDDNVETIFCAGDSRFCTIVERWTTGRSAPQLVKVHHPDVTRELCHLARDVAEHICTTHRWDADSCTQAVEPTSTMINRVSYRSPGSSPMSGTALPSAHN